MIAVPYMIVGGIVAIVAAIALHLTPRAERERRIAASLRSEAP